MPKRVAIVGIGQTYHKSKRPDVNDVEMMNEAVRAALDDAQLRIKDIDAVLLGNMELFEGNYLVDMWAVEGLGSYLKPGFKVATGGTTGGTVAECGFYHVASGLFDTALIVGYEKQDEGNSAAALMGLEDPIWYRHLSKGAIGIHARRASDYMMKSGAKEIHGAVARVKADKNAIRNPYSHLKLHITVEDVLKSPKLIYPLHLLHMCPTTCGACALIVASEERAKKITPKPVWVRDWTEAHLTKEGLFVPQLSLETAALRIYKRNGIINPFKEIDIVELYNPTAWSELQWISELHLCELSDSWKLLEKGALDIEGEMPINPSGGVVPTNPIGASGTLRIAEAALQVRGDAGEHQVTKEVKTALATAYGAVGWNTVTLLSKLPD